MNLDKYEVGFNIPAKIGMEFKDIQTPALIIDYDIFKLNISKMKNFVHNNKIKLRPHAKMHKSVDIAEYQINYGGAHGICCQKVSEAEVFAKSGIKDILITNQISNILKIDRLTRIPLLGIEIGCCVDNLQNIYDIQNSARLNKTTIKIFVEYDCGANRCGLKSFNDIEELINQINKSKNLIFSGFQAYNGSIQHIEDFNKRSLEVKKTCEKIKKLKSSFDNYKLEITGAGTGCFDLEVLENVYTEIQVGSYAFMDAHYSSLKKDHKINNTILFNNSLFILSSVMSIANNGYPVVDAGLKSMSIDSGLPKTLNMETNYIKCSDEHGVISDPNNFLKINDKICLIPGHCDPTCNLHDWYVVVKDNLVKEIWPVSARGYSF